MRHQTDKHLALEACKRSLKPGGRIVIGEELFDPEYVTSRQIDACARAVGLEVVGREGNAWAYQHLRTEKLAISSQDFGLKDAVQNCSTCRRPARKRAPWIQRSVTAWDHL